MNVIVKIIERNSIAVILRPFMTQIEEKYSSQMQLQPLKEQ